MKLVEEGVEVDVDLDMGVAVVVVVVATIVMQPIMKTLLATVGTIVNQSLLVRVLLRMDLLKGVSLVETEMEGQLKGVAMEEMEMAGPLRGVAMVDHVVLTMVVAAVVLVMGKLAMKSAHGEPLNAVVGLDAGEYSFCLSILMYTMSVM